MFANYKKKERSIESFLELSEELDTAFHEDFDFKGKLKIILSLSPPRKKTERKSLIACKSSPDFGYNKENGCLAPMQFKNTKNDFTHTASKTPHKSFIGFCQDFDGTLKDILPLSPPRIKTERKSLIASGIKTERKSLVVTGIKTERNSLVASGMKTERKSLIACKSSPDLGYNKENSCLSPMQFKNTKNDFTHSASKTPHKSFIGFCQENSSNKSTSFFRRFSLRKKITNKIEDIYSLCNKENTFTVNIRKGNHGLGLRICGGRDTSNKDPFDHLIRIKNFSYLQPALECGKLTYGDVILQVNGISFVGMTRTEAEETLRNVSDDVELVILRTPKFFFPSLSQTKVRTFNLTIFKAPKEAFGFCLWDAVHVKPYFRANLLPRTAEVKIVYRESIAHKNGIKVGDRILEVNGISLLNKTANEVIHVLRKTGYVVRMVICRME